MLNLVVVRNILRVSLVSGWRVVDESCEYIAAFSGWLEQWDITLYPLCGVKHWWQTKKGATAYPWKEHQLPDPKHGKNLRRIL